jgi:hypothetical protein
MYYIVLQLSMQKLVETRQGPFGNEKDNAHPRS